MDRDTVAAAERVEATDIELFTRISGDRNPLHYDEITGAVEVLEARQDKPITRLRTTVTRQDGTVVLDGTAVCYTTPLG